MRPDHLLASMLLVFSPVGAHAELPDLGGSGYQIEVNAEDIWQAIVDRNWDLAVNLATDLVYQEVKQRLSDEKQQKKIVEALAQQLADIINDSGKSDEEKKEEVMALMESSLSAIESAPQGDLSMAFRHSIDYGLTKVMWDEQYNRDTCEAHYLETECDDNGCWTEYRYGETDILQIPEYRLYRWVGTNSELVQKYSSKNIVNGSYYYSTGDSWGSWVKTYAQHYYDTWDSLSVDGRAFAYDPHGDMYYPGETVAYELYVDFHKYGYDCGTGKTLSSFVYIDEDGDGKMDFLPESEYQALFGRYYAWMVPVVSTILYE